MTHINHSAMYSLRTDGDQWRITKFVDGDVESSYLCSEAECECPAGHRHTCRHRQMLPNMLAHGLANTHWFYLFDQGGAIVDFNGTPKRVYDELAALPGVEVVSLEEPTELHNTLARALGEPEMAVGEAQHTEASERKRQAITDIDGIIKMVPRSNWRRL